jgi:hypothetical protein
LDKEAVGVTKADDKTDEKYLRRIMDYANHLAYISVDIEFPVLSVSSLAIKIRG